MQTVAYKVFLASRAPSSFINHISETRKYRKTSTLAFLCLVLVSLLSPGLISGTLVVVGSKRLIFLIVLHAPTNLPIPVLFNLPDRRLNISYGYALCLHKCWELIVAH